MSHTITAHLYDLESNLLADISPIALEKTIQRHLNLPRVFTIQAPAGHSLLTAIAGDGYPNLRRGNRKLVVWEDGGPGDQPLFHGRVWTNERTGDGTKNLVTITALMPLAELGYEGDDRAGRIVRGSTDAPTAGDPFGVYDGNFISPKFASYVADQDGISGPDLIWQVLTNSQNTGAESDPSPGEGPLPIYLPSDPTDGPFDVDVPPAEDLSPVDTMDWPALCGDFIQQLCSTGVCDIDEIPLDIEDALVVATPYLMSKLTSVSRLGTDRSEDVHFDYFTGLLNAKAARLVEDFSTINNKLYDYLGPRKDQSHWKANITPGSPGTTVDPSDSRTLYGGQFMSIRVFDSIGDESSSRPLYLALWNAEQFFRQEPRHMLYITPNPDSKGLFEAPTDFDVGDMIGVNVGDALGVSLAETQRVYGYSRTWDRQGVARPDQIITSAVEE